jgi:hypothetical protein
METVMAVCIGIGLAAACGFRVFVPLLVMGIGVHTGSVPTSPGFAWVGSWPGLIALGTATVVEVVAYYVPWLDHALDTIASPAAAVAGTVAMAAVLPDMPGWLKWSSAVIAGGGPATVVQSGTVVTRALSGVTTGGLGNHVVSTGELIGAIVLATLALLVPIAAAIVAICVVVWVGKRMGRWVFRRSTPERVPPVNEGAVLADGGGI